VLRAIESPHGFYPSGYSEQIQTNQTTMLTTKRKPIVRNTVVLYYHSGATSEHTTDREKTIDDWAQKLKRIYGAKHYFINPQKQ
jgi:hypothetical protein